IRRETTIGFQPTQSEKDSYEKMKAKVLEELRRTFRPEFLNRIDEIIVFHALNKEHLRKIVDIMLERLVKDLKERGVQIEFTDRAREVLTEKGYDPEVGDRKRGGEGEGEERGVSGG